MNILRLKYLIAVKVSGSFSEAAEILFTTQSTVSKQIIALERELNVQLIDRTKRRIELTKQGEVVLKYAQSIIDDYNSMITDLSFFEHYNGGNLSIASIPVMAQYNITSMVADFRQLYPFINMFVDEREGRDIGPALESRQYDLAFMREETLDSDYESIILCKDCFVAVLPMDHPLSEEKEISLDQLEDDTFLLLNKGTLLYKSCISACEKAGFTPNVTYTGTRMENIVELVGKDMGVSLMMNQAVSYIHCDNIVIVPLKEHIVSHISLVRLRKKQMTTAAKTFWDYVKANYSINQDRLLNHTSHIGLH